MNSLSKTELISTISNVTSKNILIVGDLMLDQYIWGQVDRISPEGPIPVLRVKNEEFRLGGAANVAVNVQNLKCIAYPVGIVGDDHSGKKLLEIFRSYGISTEGIVITRYFQTIVKQRAITEQQQLLRIDYESQPEELEKIQEMLLAKITNMMQKADVVIIQDYAKGALAGEMSQKVIKQAKKLDVPVLCDPGKGVALSSYNGVNSIKPNRFETEQAIGIQLDTEKSIIKAAEKIKEICDTEFITISLDKDGILFYKDSKNYEFFESHVPEVHDVTGAGDMLIATLAVLIANRVTPLLSTYIGNVAAGIETSHLGVVPIPWQEIIKHLSIDGINSKIKSLKEIIEDLQNDKNTQTVFTNGYFDNIHAGHLRFLQEINKIPGKLVVAINSDECIKRQKGSYPLLKQQDRARLLASVENIHYVMIFDEDDASKIILSLKPNVVVKGENFKNELIAEEKAIKKIGAIIEYVPHFTWKA